MWRDRTNLYISYRQSFTHHPTKKVPFGQSSSFSDSTSHPEESRRLISETGGFEDDGDAIIEMDLLPPRWVDVQDEVSELLADIAQKASHLDKLHQKHLLPGFGDEDARKHEESAIEQFTQDITTAFHECQRAVQRIETMVREAKQHGGVSSGEETMARNLQISLASRVQDSSARFRKKQSTYLKKLRGLEGLGIPSIDRVPTPVHQNPYTDPSLMESDADKSFSQTTLMQTSQRLTGQNDEAIVQRERAINDIAKGIIELSDIFRELQSIVIDQGTMLDRIDYNVERMGTEVKAADKELKTATNYQRRTVKRKVLLLLTLLVVGMFILLLVKPRGSDSSPPPERRDDQQASTTVPRMSISRRRRRSLMGTNTMRKWIDPDIDR
ncbi:t-SNARE [Aspergillus campestris IBT 28561]|uniref:t-SNARE n=1 Tax=Aspergillus campestris (strain IBT 28561) TaxID=1392248 RepID=A0A2I1CYL3_ASPC2|nr:t-SNARE [Aspergillus campestris IBT 28561]PKY02712.1 t-SNARE [Aspergillus campestris IBT 28561]